MKLDLLEYFSLLLQTDACLPNAMTFLIIANCADEAVVVDEIVDTTSFELQNVTFGKTCFVIIIPSNTLGQGSPTATIISKSLKKCAVWFWGGLMAYADYIRLH